MPSLRCLVFWIVAISHIAHGLKLIGPRPIAIALPEISEVLSTGNRREFLESLRTCTSSLQPHIDCLKTLKEKAGDAHDTLDKIKEVKITMGKIDAGFNTIKSLTNIGRLIPAVGTFMSTLNKGMGRALKTFDTGYNKIKSIESSTSSARSAAAATEKKLDQLISLLENAQTVCEKGRISFQAAVDCLEDYEGDQSSELGANLDTMVEALSSGLSLMTETIDDIGDICFITDIIRLPNVNSIESAIESFYDVLEPALSFLGDVQDVLSEEICFFGCFSVQNILDGISGALDFMFGWAFDLIDELLSGIPTPDLPNMPDFDILDGFDIDISMPHLNLGFAVDFFKAEFNKLTWDCSINVQFICLHGISLPRVDCSKGIGSFTGQEVSPSIYHGCWGNANNPALNGASYTFTVYNSIEKCKDICRRDGYRYAGLKSGNTCLCGNDYDRRISSGWCGQDCLRNHYEKCGGSGTSVYSSGYLGCWKDSQSMAILGPIYPMEEANLENCLQKCKEGGHRYAGARQSFVCSCGHTYDRFGDAPEGECNRPCRDDADQICGGTMRNSVYDVSQVGSVLDTTGCSSVEHLLGSEREKCILDSQGGLPSFVDNGSDDDDSSDDDNSDDNPFHGIVWDFQLG